MPLHDSIVALLYPVALYVARQALTGGDASKLSGKLQWASQSAFKGFGRAMLRPLIDHQKAKSPALSVELRLALLWWVELLQLELRQYHTQLSSNALPSVCHLLGAARIGGSDVVANSYTCSQTQGVRQQEWRQYFTGVPVRLALARHCGSASFCEGWRLVLL